MTKRKWREELKRRAIEAQRQREIAEMERRRLIGVKNVPAVGKDGNLPAVHSVLFVAR